MHDLGEAVVVAGGFVEHLVERSQCGQRGRVLRHGEVHGREHRPRCIRQFGNVRREDFQEIRFRRGVICIVGPGRKAEEHPAAQERIWHRQLDGMDQTGRPGHEWLAEQHGEGFAPTDFLRRLRYPRQALARAPQGTEVAIVSHRKIGFRRDEIERSAIAPGQVLAHCISRVPLEVGLRLGDRQRACERGEHLALARGHGERQSGGVRWRVRQAWDLARVGRDVRRQDQFATGKRACCRPSRDRLRERLARVAERADEEVQGELPGRRIPALQIGDDRKFRGVHGGCLRPRVPTSR